jgi:RNA polymerase sigma-70 factor (sigma-E family)
VSGFSCVSATVPGRGASSTECMSAAVGDLVAEGVSADRLGDLYEVHAADALRLAYLLTGDRMVAQDLVQDAFVKVAGRLTHLRRADAFGAYLRVTVVNMARMRGRRLKVERDYLARHSADLREPHRDPDMAETETLRVALERLPFKQRAAIVLRFFEDVPDDVTAQVLGCRQATVRSHIHRGLEALRAELGEWVP